MEHYLHLYVIIKQTPTVMEAQIVKLSNVPLTISKAQAKLEIARAIAAFKKGILKF